MVGAVAPSSRGLAELLAGVVPRPGSEPRQDRVVVVELGPGTGAITEAIEQRLPDRARHLAVDSNPAMVEFLRERCPGLEAVQGDAAELGALLAERSVGPVDAVVSGLPWSLFRAAQQDAILTSVSAALRPDGVFTTFAYLHARPLTAARRFRSRLRAHFDEVVTTRNVWRNLPPAFGYVCRRPVAARSPVG
jgi:phospholipid N-methyltransferase